MRLAGSNHLRDDKHEIRRIFEGFCRDKSLRVRRTTKKVPMRQYKSKKGACTF